MESRKSDHKLKPLPPGPFHHQDSAIAWQPDMILSLSMILAVVIGFSIQRASICMVKAVAEIFTTHRAFMLISFAKTILWIELVMIPLTWLFPDVRANRHILGFSWAAVTGGIVFGIGAAVKLFRF
jgi:hypothetical protein